jgi:hypothetical protein
VFRAEIGGRRLTFFHTGMRGVNMTFQDRETRTRWQQETGEAFDGPLKGRRLDIYPFIITTWKEWRARHPETLAMTPVPGLTEMYDLMWRAIQARTPDKPGPPADRTLRAEEDSRLAAYEPVVGVDIGDKRRAYTLAALKRDRVVNDRLGTEAVLIVYMAASDTVTVFSRTLRARTLTFQPGAAGELIDRETGSRWSGYGECLDGPLRGGALPMLLGVRQFWWAWAAFYPDTDIYDGSGNSQR